MEWTMSLERVARRSLEANLVRCRGKSYLRAGAHQFASLWTRDFAYSIPALVQIGRVDVVRDHLGALLDHLDAEGLVPRILEKGGSRRTVLKWTVGRPFFRSGSERADWGEVRLRAEHRGEHGTRAIDSGLLIWLEADALIRAGKLPSDETRLAKVLEGYARWTEGFSRLLEQMDFEDWQDSARRNGVQSYSNFLLLLCLKQASRQGLVDAARAREFEDLFWLHFGLEDSSLIPASSAGERFSLETQLHFLDASKGFPEWADRARSLWSELKSTELWRERIGVPVSVPYDTRDISWTTKVVGLRSYHDGFRWTWLMADAARACYQAGEAAEGDRILTGIQDCCQDPGVPEILESRLNQAVQRLFYRSEAPFSWGAARVLMALEARRLSS